MFVNIPNIEAVHDDFPTLVSRFRYFLRHPTNILRSKNYLNIEINMEMLSFPLLFLPIKVFVLFA